MFLVGTGIGELPLSRELIMNGHSAVRSYFAGRLAACLPARRPENMQSEMEMPLAK